MNALNGYLNPTDHSQRKITQADKDFAKRLDFKDIKFPVKVRDIPKTEKNRSPSTLVFLVMKTRINIQFMYQKSVVNKKHVDLLLIEKKGQRHYDPIKDVNIFMYNHTLHHRKDIFFAILYKFLEKKKY